MRRLTTGEMHASIERVQQLTLIFDTETNSACLNLSHPDENTDAYAEILQLMRLMRAEQEATIQETMELVARGTPINAAHVSELVKNRETAGQLQRKFDLAVNRFARVLGLWSKRVCTQFNDTVDQNSDTTID